MPAFVDLTGRRYGRLSVVALLKRDRCSFWTCLCDCGKPLVVRSMDLGSGNTQSCGCYKIDRAREANTTHGHNARGRRTPEYRAWVHAKDRCYRRACRNYPEYGGRGIRMCAEWLDDFAAFFAHIGMKPSPRHVLDRRENDGNYEPGNVRWATPQESARNRRRQRTFLGRPLPWYAAQQAAAS